MRQLLYIFVATILLVSCRDEKIPTVVVVKNDETYAPDRVRPVLDKWQQATFSYFYQGASPTTGMALEGNERGDVVTTGGTGFGIMALIVGAERGYISRAQASACVQKIVQFLGKAERFKGVWSHWYNTDGTAHPFGDQVKTGDLIETGFLVAGLLTASEYFTASSGVEQEIRDSVNSFWETIDWNAYTNGQQYLHWLWYSQTNRFALPIRGWHEGWITYLLALAAPGEHAIPVEVYENGWQKGGAIAQPGRQYYGYTLPMGESYGGPLFFAHYSFLGLDPRNLEDAYVNYWNQNTAHTLINRHYCVYEAPKEYKYSATDWGLTACYGAKPPLWNYSARSPSNDDGVIAPTASLGSYPYTPFYSTQMLLRLNEYPLAHGTYGFADAYAPSTATSDKRHLAIDQGPVVVMMENYRSGLIWSLMMKSEKIKRALQLAGVKSVPGYADGFIRAITNTATSEYDLMRHPDRGRYELDLYSGQAGSAGLKLKNAEGTQVMDTSFTVGAGEHRFSVGVSSKLISGKRYTATLTTPSGKSSVLTVRLR